MKLSTMEDGLQIYDKWRTGPFTDIRTTEALDKWIWDHMGDIFDLLDDLHSFCVRNNLVNKDEL